MFDFRYHIVSLAAVFLALVIGILVGIGLSGKGFVDDAERANLQQEIATLKNERGQARTAADAATERLLALQDLVDEAYRPLVSGRLEKRRIALLFVGNVDEPIRQSVSAAVRDAGGAVVKIRALRVPIDAEGIAKAVAGRPQLAAYARDNALSRIPPDLVSQLVTGGRSPLWAELTSVLVGEQTGKGQTPIDGVVVARTAKAQQGVTAEFLGSLYRSLARAGVPTVGVEEAGSAQEAVVAFARNGLSTVDSIDTSAGQLALVVLLAGGQPGRYGVGATAKSGIVPPLELPG